MQPSLPYRQSVIFWGEETDMKNTIIIIGCLLLLLLSCGCKSKEQNDMESKKTKTVVFINGVQDADVWLLPQTEANLKTTVWGTASASGVKTGESRRISLGEPGDDGLYLFRMIDSESFFYSADALTLEDGWTLQVTGVKLQSVTLEITNEKGESVGTYEVFSAKL